MPGISSFIIYSGTLNPTRQCLEDDEKVGRGKISRFTLSGSKPCLCEPGIWFRIQDVMWVSCHRVFLLLSLGFDKVHFLNRWQLFTNNTNNIVSTIYEGNIVRSEMSKIIVKQLYQATLLFSVKCLLITYLLIELKSKKNQLGF